MSARHGFATERTTGSFPASPARFAVTAAATWFYIVMKQIGIALLVVGGLAGLGHAGLKGTYPVSINTSLRLTTGGLASARSSAYGNMHIGCYVSVSANPTTSYYGYCQANNGQGTSSICTTHNPDLVMQMRSLQGDSRLTFEWDTSGNCIGITVQSSSTAAPKEP